MTTVVLPCVAWQRARRPLAQVVYPILALLSLLTISRPIEAQFVTGRVAGSVRNQATRQPIGDAQISVVGQTATARSDSLGRFVLINVPIGTVTLQVIKLGMQPLRKTDVLVNRNRTTPVELELVDASRLLSGVDVQASLGHVQPSAQAPTSRVQMTYEEVRRSPGAIGDVNRLVQAMPGVLSGNDTRNDIIARGGSPSENMTLIDGFEMPNINHFGTQGGSGGPISMLNNELLSDATFYAGGMRTQYGNRLSSLLDIRLREGTREQWRSELDISNAGAGIIAEGPLGGTGTFIASARQSYYSLIAPAIGLTAIPYTTNFQMKATLEPNAANRWWLVGLGGVEWLDIDSDSSDIENPNPIGTTRVRSNRWLAGIGWQRLYSERLHGTLLVSANTQDRAIELVERASGLEPVFRTDGRENELNARYDLRYTARNGLDVSAGLASKTQWTDSDMHSPLGFRNPYSTQPRVHPLHATTSLSATSFGGNLEVSQRVQSFVDVSASARVDHFDLTNVTTISPRGAVIVHLRPSLSLTGTWGRYYQQVPMVYVANLDVNRNLSPMRADHAIGGMVWTPRPDMKVTVEAYDKQYRDYAVARDYPQLSLANTGDQTAGPQGAIYPLTNAGRGRVRGVEFFAQQKFTGSTYGQVSYAHSRTENEALDGISRPGAYDAPNLATLILGRKSGPLWEYSVRASYSTGRPTTPLIDSLSTAQNRLVFDVERLNSERTPDYLRIDLRVDRRFAVRNGTLAMYVEVQNMTNRDNRTVRVWNAKTARPDWETQVGFLPIFGVNWKF